MSRRNENGITMNRAFAKLFTEGCRELQDHREAGHSCDNCGNTGICTFHRKAPGYVCNDWKPQPATFAGETDTEIMPDGSSYRSRYAFRVF